MEKKCGTTRLILDKEITFMVETQNEKRELISVPVNLKYGQLIFQTVNRPSDGKSFKYEEIKMLDRIKSATENPNENKEIELGLADLNVLKEKLKTMGWPISRIEYVEFTDYINSL